MGWREILDVEAGTVRETALGRREGAEQPPPLRSRFATPEESETEKLLRQHPAEVERLKAMCVAEGVDFELIRRNPAELRGWLETIAENETVRRRETPARFTGRAICQRCGPAAIGPEADGLDLQACPWCSDKGETPGRSSLTLVQASLRPAPPFRSIDALQLSAAVGAGAPR